MAEETLFEKQTLPEKKVNLNQVNCIAERTYSTFDSQESIVAQESLLEVKKRLFVQPDHC